ncbi:MAG: polyprenyl synthetase family protein [Anaerolineae bacterium]|nr:polyprenyl synthetase family protein [Thermoflexales bacterium]MDW8408792.1 polyprenyl synthetase family protein [Anaerolineae bacterium]
MDTLSGLAREVTAGQSNRMESTHGMEAASGSTRNGPHRAIDLIQPQMAQVEATLLNLPDLQPVELRQAVEAIVKSGGKRIRPTVTLLVAGLLNNLHNERIIHLASAVEMLHTATLVHDDLIDGSLMRRGASTLNARWTPAATVLTGDYLFATAASLAAQTNSVRVMSIFAETLSVIVAGELQQQFTDWAKRSTRDDYYRRIYAKTASMFVLATTAAGVLSNADEAQMAALLDYGRDLGMAFQIMDDILDFTGEQAAVGKPVGSDLRRGLITLPTICYIESHERDAQIECALRGECDPQTYDALVQHIRTSGAVETALAEAQKIAASAKRALADFPDNAYRATLVELVDYTVQRNK